MTHSALIAFGPVYNGKRHAEAESGLFPGRIVYDQGALRTAYREIPIFVDHRKDRRVGVIQDLFTFEDVDGGWLSARADITDPPGWLKRGTPASVSFVPFMMRDLNKQQYVNDGLLLELSILSPGTQPAESMARVLTVSPKEEPVQQRAVTVIDHTSRERSTRGVSSRGDRYLSRHELATFIEIAKASPVEDLARLLQGSGARTSPDPYLGDRSF